MTDSSIFRKNLYSPAGTQISGKRHDPHAQFYPVSIDADALCLLMLAYLARLHRVLTYFWVPNPATLKFSCPIVDIFHSFFVLSSLFCPKSVRLLSDFCPKVSGFSRKMSRFLSDFCRGSVWFSNNYEKLRHDPNPIVQPQFVNPELDRDCFEQRPCFLVKKCQKMSFL